MQNIFIISFLTEVEFSTPVNKHGENKIKNSKFQVRDCPVAEFSVSVCITLKFICTPNDGVPTLLITENDTSYKSNIYKNKIMWILYPFKVEFMFKKR